jgi:hypothetical protein
MKQTIEQNVCVNIQALLGKSNLGIINISYKNYKKA